MLVINRKKGQSVRIGSAKKHVLITINWVGGYTVSVKCESHGGEHLNPVGLPREVREANIILHLHQELVVTGENGDSLRMRVSGLRGSRVKLAFTTDNSMRIARGEIPISPRKERASVA